jgi:hypothetical protein
MITRARVLISVAVAIAVGVIVLLGYFVNIPLFVTLRTVFLRWAVILVAIALLVGVANLFMVHWNRLAHQQSGGGYSLILILSLVVTLVVTAIYSPTGVWSMWIFNYVQVPIESSLMAILVVVLAYGSARLLRNRINLFSLLFIGTVLLVLLGTATIPYFEVPELGLIRAWIERIPAVAGARGLLLGIALGTVATGLRVLTGADRPYGG